MAKATEVKPTEPTSEGTAGTDEPAGALPVESLEQGTWASTYVDNPDKPDPSSVAQLEVLPDEEAPSSSEGEGA
jgi:hypothetical protein